MKKQIILFIGTRPEAIKVLPLFLQLKREHSDVFETLLCNTGQHRSMVDQILELFEVVPDFDLDVMKEGQSLDELSARVLTKTTTLIKEKKPDAILVQGDTTTAFVVALAAFYQKKTIIHLEAGLRTRNIYSPFPEEANRKFVSCIANFHLAPTKNNANNLLSEGIMGSNILIAGNTVIDALLMTSKKINSSESLRTSITSKLISKGYQIGKSNYILITGHRRENFGEGFKQICGAILELSKSFQEIDWVYPVHLNPNVHSIVHELLGNRPNVFLLPPLDYAEFLLLMGDALAVLTDSGGVQEEAPSLGKPVYVMRDTTERQEGLEAGLVSLVGKEKETIVSAVKDGIENSFSKFNLNAKNPYGNGEASTIIGGFLREKLIGD